MTYRTIISHSGLPVRVVLRNCDRCTNIADAKGKFKAERSIPDGNQNGNFWRSLAEWMMEAAK